MTIIPSRIKQLRQKLGLTQAEFGKRVYAAQTYISQLENGAENPSIKLLKLISYEFDVSFKWLMGENESQDIQDDLAAKSKSGFKKGNITYNSTYEAYAHLLDSVQDLEETHTKLSEHLACLWEAIRMEQFSETEQNILNNFEMVIAIHKLELAYLTANFSEMQRILEAEINKRTQGS